MYGTVGLITMCAGLLSLPLVTPRTSGATNMTLSVPRVTMHIPYGTGDAAVDTTGVHREGSFGAIISSFQPDGEHGLWLLPSTASDILLHFESDSLGAVSSDTLRLPCRSRAFVMSPEAVYTVTRGPRRSSPVEVWRADRQGVSSRCAVEVSDRGESSVWTGGILRVRGTGVVYTCYAGDPRSLLVGSLGGHLPPAVGVDSGVLGIPCGDGTLVWQDTKRILRGQSVLMEIPYNRKETLWDVLENGDFVLASSRERVQDTSCATVYRFYSATGRPTRQIVFGCEGTRFLIEQDTWCTADGLWLLRAGEDGLDLLRFE